MTGRIAILRRVEALEASASIAPPDALRAQISAEVRALLAAVPHEDDRAALLHRIGDGSASDADRDRLAACSLGTLRAVVSLSASI